MGEQPVIVVPICPEVPLLVCLSQHTILVVLRRVKVNFRDFYGNPV